jgi:probable phosphoglycerate mutase
MRLSKQGVAEMERTGRHLADTSLAAIYTSPLLRARASAAHIAAHQPEAPVRRCAWLAEVRTSWEGESNKAVREIRGFSYYDPLKGVDDETIFDVFGRMNRALRMVLHRHPGQTTVCVSHGDPIKILRVGYSGKRLTPDNIRVPDPGQASLVVFSFWHPDALPVISAMDLNRMERVIAGKEPPPEPPPAEPDRTGPSSDSTSSRPPALSHG